MTNKKSVFLAGLLAFFSCTAWADYADDRALIEDLHARYLFAFDFGDAEGYAGTFAPNGVLNFGWGDVVGREAIAEFIGAPDEEPSLFLPNGDRRPVGRHVVNNMVVSIDGDTATGRAYWTHMTSDETGYGTVDFFGHYEDTMVRIDGQWYYQERHVYNEAIPEWASTPGINPVKTKSPPPQETEPSQ